VKDLSWEDKELVLRVLFAKMNGSAAGVSKGTMQSVHMQQYALLRQQQHTGDMPQPVFLSEGADLPPSAGAAEYQGAYRTVRCDAYGVGCGVVLLCAAALLCCIVLYCMTVSLALSRIMQEPITAHCATF
jgi:hypothetical protein